MILTTWTSCTQNHCRLKRCGQETANGETSSSTWAGYTNLLVNLSEIQYLWPKIIELNIIFLLFHGKKCSWKEQYNTKWNYQKALFIYFHVLEKRLLLSAHLKQHQPSPPKAPLGARQHTSPWAEQTQDLYRILLFGPAVVVPRLFQTQHLLPGGRSKCQSLQDKHQQLDAPGWH